MVAALVEHSIADQLFDHSGGGVERRRQPLERPFEGGRGHANDRVRAPADPELASDDVGAPGEGALPVAMGEHHHGVAPTRHIVFREQHPTEGGIDAQHREVVPRHDLGEQRAHALLSINLRRDDLRGADVREHVAGAIPEILDLWIRQRAVGKRGLVQVDVHDPFRPLDGGVAEHDRVDEREDRRIGADADRQRQDRDRRKARTAHQRPNRVAKIAPEMIVPVTHCLF